MFPKILKVAAARGSRISGYEWINETHFIKKTLLLYKDQTILNAYSGALGFSYEVLLPPEGEFGWRLPNGSWTGALGMLQRREVDMVVGNLIIDERLHEDFRLSYPHTAYETTFMTEKHEPVPVVAYFLHPFSIPVWLSLIACIFLMSFLLYYLLRRKHTAVSLFTSTVGSLVGQGIGITPQRRADYFALVPWIVSSAFLYHFYAAVLLSFLTFPSLHGIQTIDDLAGGIKDGTYECSTYPYQYPIPRYLIQSENPTVKIIVNNLNYQRNDNIIGYLETCAGGKKPAFVGVRQDFNPYKDHYFVSEENFFTVTSAYAINKDFCCGSELDKVVHRAWASGIFQHIQDIIDDSRFREDREVYGKLWENSPSGGNLNMKLLKGPFIFLIASHSLAFLVFLLEICTEKFKRFQCFRNLDLEKQNKTFTLTVVPSGSVLVVKRKISGRHRPRVTKRRKYRFKNSLSIATPIANFPEP